MSKEDAPYFIVSESGFGGQLFRAADRYVKQESTRPIPTSTSYENGAIVTVRGKESDLGSIIMVTARPNTSPSSPTIEVGIIKTTDPDDFKKFIRSRRSPKGPLDPEQILTTSTPPESFALSLLLLAISRQERTFDAAGNFRQVILGNSAYPFQNPDILTDRIKDSAGRGRLFKIGCFACLTLPCVPQNGLPSYSIDIWAKNRLETGYIRRKTDYLLEQLKQTGFAFTWDFLIADTDPYEIYAEWLREDPRYKINQFTSQLTTKVSLPTPEVIIRKWSDIQLNYQGQYQTDFQMVVENTESFVGREYIDRSTIRRVKYFEQKGLPESPVTRQIAETTARRNVALYAAQGPILEAEYDCLVIADPDPLRLGKIQSLLAPNLPIWYPYPG